MTTQTTISTIISSNQQIDGNYTNEQINEYFQEHNCTILRFPKNGYSENTLTFYRNDDPSRIMYTTLGRFVRNPNKLYQKDYGYMRKNNIILTETKEQRLEKQRQTYENELQESMKQEDSSDDRFIIGTRYFSTVGYPILLNSILNINFFPT